MIDSGSSLYVSGEQRPSKHRLPSPADARLAPGMRNESCPEEECDEKSRLVYVCHHHGAAGIKLAGRSQRQGCYHARRGRGDECSPADSGLLPAAVSADLPGGHAAHRTVAEAQLRERSRITFTRAFAITCSTACSTARSAGVVVRATAPAHHLPPPAMR